MLQFIPYLAPGNDAVSRDLYAIALESWLVQLNTLLDLPDFDFKVQVADNTSLCSFVQTALNTHLDGHPAPAELLKHIFYVYGRIGLVCNAGSRDTGLLQPTLLYTIALVYGSSNPAAVRRVFDALQPPTHTTLQTLLDQPPAPVAARALNAILSATANQKTPDDDDTIIEQWLIQNYSAAPDLVTKRAMVASLYQLIQLHVLTPLRQRETACIEPFSEKLLAWIESSDITEKRQAWVNAPLIMDLEVDCQLSSELDSIHQSVYQGDMAEIDFWKLSLEQVRDMSIANPDVAAQKSRKRSTKTKEKESVLHETAAAAAAPPTADTLDRTGKIAQVRDMFPDLGEGFVEACLVVNGDNAEAVIMQLLDENLPPSVADLDRSMPRKKPEEGLLASRHNIFDNDEFDLLSRDKSSVDATKMYMGKKNHGTTQALLDDKSFVQTEKTNMLERIYNMYEDEYDDTYDDINEVSGRVDVDDVAEEDDAAVEKVNQRRQQQLLEDAEAKKVEENQQMELARLYVSNPDAFVRNRTARQSKARVELRKKTGLSDEQIEGWATRDPRRDKVIEKLMHFDGSQPALDNRSIDSSSNKETDKRKGSNRRAPPKPRSDEKDRAFKDKNKARFANHNRKKGHDKKMTKAGAGPSA
ncbi:hypothetical protein BCR43DRAFT_523222 [Syncephalastrum racemosum]|uniref:CUE domain-containing protein n=1 Tax=Syncephalastrum racemosum TaxID=13706 RepID=A0A1X2HJL4_SYNRA|nr:hypothetical protein BCR43DRAFT_523222 [Syncephalastrum racemosum]